MLIVNGAASLPPLVKWQIDMKVQCFGQVSRLGLAWETQSTEEHIHTHTHTSKQRNVFVYVHVRVYICFPEWHQSLCAHTFLFTISCSFKKCLTSTHTHTESQNTHTYTGYYWLLNMTLRLALYTTFLHTHTHTNRFMHAHSRSLLVMAASSIFSVFLIIWSVGHRPCRFHGPMLLIKINSIQLHRSWGLLLHNWIWVDNESSAEF